ncbi:Repeat domain-containing protein [Planctomicrobium piriforme]|uniref:Repeat domain-containing protein n=2 Tax=Planctomicrobium piriforme TaxID=1576369 RepID=A0A1I3L912_9PLAN|nr:Repeat domain-containing protein [Planctomicrobium piriforme]
MRGVWLIVAVFSATALKAEMRFTEQVIDPQIGKVCYAVTLADVNGDGRQDVVAVSENRVLWYENPSWSPRVIIADQTVTDNVCIAPYDIDGDGQIDFAVGAGWMGKNTGTIQWVRRGASLDEKWTVYPIGAEPSLHRMRFADVLGTGRPQLVISPLNASQGTGVRLMAFEIPRDPAKDRWPETVLNQDLNRMHNHWHVDFNGDGLTDTITSAREGVHLVAKDKEAFTATKLGVGATAADPNLNGAGEIKSGRLKNGGVFLTSVEPMHGTMLAVYLPPEKPDELWRRIVIDEGFKRGHALWTADMNGDGADEIIFGHSDTPTAFGVNVYTATSEDGSQWTKQVVDAGGMATEDLIVGDLNNDSKPDIIAGGRSTQNVKIYWNGK